MCKYHQTLGIVSTTKFLWYTCISFSPNAHISEESHGTKGPQSLAAFAHGNSATLSCLCKSFLRLIVSHLQRNVIANSVYCHHTVTTWQLAAHTSLQVSKKKATIRGCHVVWLFLNLFVLHFRNAPDDKLAIWLVPGLEEQTHKGKLRRYIVMFSM